MMLKNNMFSRVGKLLVAGLLVVYGNVGYAQSNVQRRADTLIACMPNLVTFLKVF